MQGHPPPQPLPFGCSLRRRDPPQDLFASKHEPVYQATEEPAHGCNFGEPPSWQGRLRCSTVTLMNPEYGTHKFVHNQVREGGGEERGDSGANRRHPSLCSASQPWNPGAI